MKRSSSSESVGKPITDRGVSAFELKRKLMSEGYAERAIERTIQRALDRGDLHLGKHLRLFVSYRPKPVEEIRRIQAAGQKVARRMGGCFRLDPHKVAWRLCTLHTKGNER